MAGLHGTRRIVTLLLLLQLVCVSITSVDAAPSWDYPFITADTSDVYIKAMDESNSVLTIYEDVPIGHKIGVLHITAQAGDTVVVTQHGTDEIQLSFDGTNTEQNVYIQSVIDREKTTGSISVGVSLNGGQTQYLSIDVADVNDNTPTFEDQGSQISLDVPENILNDSLLVLTAADADLGATATLTYIMDTNGFDDIFTLTSITKDGKPACQLGLLKELDFETRPLYKLTITVKDSPDVRGNTFNSTVTVFVNVVDVGDSAPRWLLAPMASSIDENLPQGTELFSVSAIDGDTFVDNDIGYSIADEKPEGFVNIDPVTGNVTLKTSVDREDAALADLCFISIVIQAREMPKENPDQPCSDITCVNGTALITVNDLDDNSPQFDQSSYSVSFPENTSAAIGQLITVSDHDATPAMNMMQLKLSGAPEGVFDLTNSHGPSPLATYIEVINKDYMDYEREDRRHITFQIVATSDSQPPRMSSASVTINLTDIND